jgi:serine/threonine protein phosphatase PrpC
VIPDHRHYLVVAHAMRAAAGHGQDRVAVVRVGEGVVLAVADGSGGMRGAGEAADRAIQLVTEYAQDTTAEEGELAALVARIDADANDGSGQCALVIAAVRDGMIVGASAGDCGAWLIHEGIEDLTEQQVRKPLLGSGFAVPVPFREPLGLGTLLLASDGLLKYARREAIAQVALGEDLGAAAHELVRLPQLRSGEVPDDVAVVLCRARAV